MKRLRFVAVVMACVLLLGSFMTGCRKGGDEYEYLSYWVYDDEGNIVNGNTEAGDKDGDKDSDNGTGEIVSAGFDRNEDGTSTDKETGIVFLDDDLDNWNKVYVPISAICGRHTVTIFAYLIWNVRT